MAYNRKYLTLLSEASGVVGMKHWVLDTVDTIATVNTAGHISDAKTLGMEKGDMVTVRIWTTSVPADSDEKLTAAATANVLTAVYLCWVIGMSTAGAADLTDGLAITATNTD